MRYADSLILELDDLLSRGEYRAIETEKLELKDLSNAGEWKELYKTICAFLNSEGGIVIVGIKEQISKDSKNYKLTGFNSNLEPKITGLHTQFTDSKGQPIEGLESCFPKPELKQIQDKQVLVLYVDSLLPEQKYAYYEKSAYERKLTGDHKIPKEKIAAYNEIKKDILSFYEMRPVIGASIDDIDLDKLNEYIDLLNKNKRIVNSKNSLTEAIPFLEKRRFIRNDEPTVLGMLVCGKEPENYLHRRCQVDCFVDSITTIVQDKKTLTGNIIPLVTESERYVFRNIQVGVSSEKGGTQLPEYPQELLRESINNVLAHRDYSVNRYININIKQGIHLEIRNPGAFKQNLLIESPKDHIRRIIPGDPTFNVNPRLTDVLKVFNKWEGKGIGMRTLTDEALKNNIDVPYYIFHNDNDLSLVIPKGKVLDAKTEILFELYDGYIINKTNGRDLTEEQKVILAYLFKSQQLNKTYKHTILLTKDNNHLDAVQTLLSYGLIHDWEGTERKKYHPVYLVDAEFFKTDFYPELRNLFGKKFDQLGFRYKELLQAIYKYNEYSKEGAISANKAGLMLWMEEAKDTTDLAKYENFKRAVRNQVNALEKGGFVLKLENKLYTINKELTNDLFS